MVHLSTQISHHRLQDKKESLSESMEINSNILHVVRQALLNAAEELISQQEQTNPKPLTNKRPFVDNRNYSSKTGNVIKKKKPLKKKKKTNRRK